MLGSRVLVHSGAKATPGNALRQVPPSVNILQIQPLLGLCLPQSHRQDMRPFRHCDRVAGDHPLLGLSLPCSCGPTTWGHASLTQ